jgi:hypothetical protein
MFTVPTPTIRLRTLTLLFLSTLGLFADLRAQNTITCEASSTTLCQGSIFTVDYTATGSFDGPNVFSVFLSDGFGYFIPTTIIGQYASTVSGQITCSIPVNAVPGSGYRIRVDGTEPLTNGDPNLVDMTIIEAPDAGSNDSLALCSNGSTIFLTTGGDPVGTWLDPNMVPTSPVFDPGMDVPGCYSYVVQGNTPCPNDTATFCVNVISAPDAGPNSSITACANGDTIALFEGGVWTGPDGGPHPGYFVPGEDAPGCYTYTVIGQAPCANDVSILCITVVAAPDAGTSVVDTICADGPPVLMFDLHGGAPQPGGDWSYLGAPHSPIYVPAVDQPGCYDYVVQGTAPCVSDTAQFCVFEVPPPDVGTDSNVVFCSDAAPVIMLSYLGGTPQPGGTWTDPTGAMHSGIFDPAVDPAGCYVYVVEGTPPCEDEVAMLCVFISQAPDAGISVMDTVCVDGPPVVMLEQLDGSPQQTGSWSFMGAPHLPVFFPGQDLEGCYHYVVQAGAPCVDDSSVWCVVVDSCLNVGSTELTGPFQGLRQIDGWGTDHSTFVFGAAISEGTLPVVLDALGRRVECRAARSSRADGTVFSLDLSGLVPGGYWVVVSDGTQHGTLRITKW